MKNLYSIILVILINSAFVNSQPMVDLTIIDETKNSITLEFKPVISKQQILTKSGSILTKFDFFGSQIKYDSFGNAEFFRAVLLLFPSEKYSLQISATESELIDSVELIRKPRLKNLSDFGVAEEFENQPLDSSNQIIQYPIAEIADIENTSVGIIGRLILRPIHKVEKGRVRIYSRFKLTINFMDGFTENVKVSSLLKGEIPKTVRSLKKLNIDAKNASLKVSQLSQGNWYKIEVQDAGMYKIDNNYLRQLNITYSDIAKLRIFGNSGTIIPDDPNVVFPDSLVEISRYIVRKNTSNIPSPDDFIIFYGKGSTGWNYRGQNNFQHYINPYTDKNCYFFTFDQIDGKSMDSIVATDGPLPTHQPTSFREKIFIEKELYNIGNSGRRWIGKLFSGSDNSETYRNSLPGFVSSSTISYTFNFARRSKTVDYLSVFENGQRFIYRSMTPAFDAENIYYAHGLSVTGAWSGGVADNASVLKILVESANDDAKTWLDWIEIFYDRKFEAINDALIFTSPDLSGSIQYVASNFTSNEIYAFDVTSHSNVKRIVQLEIEPNNSSVRKFKLQQTSGTVREIAIVGIGALRTPPTAVNVPNSNLRSAQNQAEFVIITPTEFIPIANKLKNHRETMGEPLMTTVVDVNHIYNEFNCGVSDPLSIRSFLKFTQQRWSIVPQYVLLLGSGHFDYKNILKTNVRNWIPVYETEESFFDYNSFTTDDVYAIFRSIYSIAIGRIPARNYNEAEITVNKIISYEKNSPIAPWRNKITFIADDGRTSEGDDGQIYTTDTDAGLAENPFVVPESFEKNKIYIVAYPTVNSSAGRRKPNVNKDIVEAINNGTLITNFIGHGNERLWAHEAIFTREDELPKLTNKNFLTLVFAATCSYGRFDDPKEISAAEKILLMEQGGAIVSISAARKVFNGDNVQLNKVFYSNLLFKNAQKKIPRIGDAWRNAKATLSAGLYSNTRKFFLFGDPSMKLLLPEGNASVDSINGNSLVSNVNIKIKSLERIMIAGTVSLSDTTIGFNGRANLQLLDAKKAIEIKEGKGTFRFNVVGGPLFNGDVTVANGKFKAIIPIPKDVNFGKTSRLTLYAWNNITDAVGYTEKITVEGVDTTKEFNGPNISIFLEDYNFRSGDVVNANPMLIVKLADESGVNTSTAGVGHQLSAELINPSRFFDLSSYYTTDLDTYKSGEARYKLTGLEDGKYNLKVKAWDIYNNNAESEISFIVYNATDLALLNMMNYPNPFSNSTTFTFQRNSTEPIEVEIKIYSVAGRLLNRFSTITSERFVKVQWDGKDYEGDNLSNGIYFYKIIARNHVSKQSNERTGKFAILR